MPQEVKCSKCGTTLYRSEKIISVDEIINAWRGVCPKCGKELTPPSKMGINVVPPPEGELEIIVLPKEEKTHELILKKPLRPIQVNFVETFHKEINKLIKDFGLFGVSEEIKNVAGYRKIRDGVVRYVRLSLDREHHEPYRNVKHVVEVDFERETCTYYERKSLLGEWKKVDPREISLGLRIEYEIKLKRRLEILEKLLKNHQEKLSISAKKESITRLEHDFLTLFDNGINKLIERFGLFDVSEKIWLVGGKKTKKGNQVKFLHLPLDEDSCYFAKHAVRINFTKKSSRYIIRYFRGGQWIGVHPTNVPLELRIEYQKKLIEKLGKLNKILSSKEKFKLFTPFKSDRKNKDDIRANILLGLKEGVSLEKIFGPKGLYLPSFYMENLDYLISIGYVDKDTNKPTETGLLFLHAYESLRKLLEDEDVEEYLVLDKGVKEFSLNLIKNIEQRVDYDILSNILLEAKGSEYKSRIIKRVSLSFSQVNEYLKKLTEARLIERIYDDKNPNNKIYKTTPQGLEYIQRYLYFILFARSNNPDEKWQILD